jgi:glutathione S-transferase
MKLYQAPASPFARKVRVVLREAGLEGRIEEITSSGTALDPGTIRVAVNPLGKIPSLEREDGPSIYDSRVICRYLDYVGKAGLYPEPPRLWDTLTLEATADGMMDASILMIYEGRVRPEEKQFPEWVEAQWGKVARSLDVLEGRWMAHLTGPFDIGQIAVGCALGYLDLRHAARNWRDGRPQLAAWAEKLGERPSMAATVPA